MAALRVGGLTPLTTIDFPGELAAVVYCQGCPWRCAYCHNGHLLPTRAAQLIPWDAVVSFLEGRVGLLDGVVFSGGEPTLQSGLRAAMESVRGLGFKVALHTAGPYPARLQRVLPLVDWVGLDVKALPDDYPEVTGVPGSGTRAWTSLDLVLRSGVPHEIRTTPMPGRDHPADLERLARRLRESGVQRHRIQACRIERAAYPERLGGEGRPPVSALVSWDPVPRAAQA